MKIGIIGLRTRQLETLRQHQFGAEIIPYERDAITKTAIEGFSNRMDRVIYMTGHLPKHAHNYIPKGKIHIVPGNVGLSGLIRHLNENYPTKLTAKQEPLKNRTSTPEKAETPSPIEAVEKTSKEQKFIDATPQYQKVYDAKMGLIKAAALWKCSLLPNARCLRYRTDSTPLEVPKTGGRKTNDYSLLMAAETGDVLRYSHDPNKPLAALKANYQNQRKIYTKKLNREIEVHIFSTYADFYVSEELTGQADVIGAILSDVDHWKRLVALAMGGIELTESSTRLVKRPNNTPMGDVEQSVQQTVKVEPVPVASIIESAVVIPTDSTSQPTPVRKILHGPETPIQHGSPEIPQQPAQRERQTLTSLEIEYWKQVTLTMLSDGEDIESAIESAGDMVRALRKVCDEGL